MKPMNRQPEWMERNRRIEETLARLQAAPGPEREAAVSGLHETAAAAAIRPAAARPKRRRARTVLFMLLLLTALTVVVWERLLPLEQLPLPLPEKAVPPVTGLHPIVEAKANALEAAAAKKGIVILITDGYRSAEEQNALYRQGRSDPGAIVTNAKGGDSYHNYGLAVDFALRTADGGVIWDMEADGNGNGKSDWMEVVALARQLGFAWGGDWQSFPDYPHLQMDFGYSIGELKRGKRPPAETTIQAAQ